MPSKDNYSYCPPFPLCFGHAETIFPALFRKVKNVPEPEHERIFTPDLDFLDLFWYRQQSKKLAVIQHGLEGSADRPYILGMAKCFYEEGYDALTWNYRSCGHEMNRTSKFYHSGATYDLDLVLNHAMPAYEEIYLVGFSLGGNLTLKYLGEKQRSPKIKRAVAISAPLDLDKGADNLNTGKGFVYQRRFVKKLVQKVKRKHQLYPDMIDISPLEKVTNLRDFDDCFTAPIHGFKDAKEYYAQCSAKFYLGGITVPTLIVNAKNDPILGLESLDHGLAKNLRMVTLETTRFGGHVGYSCFGPKTYWSERRTVDFCANRE